MNIMDKAYKPYKTELHSGHILPNKEKHMQTCQNNGVFGFSLYSAERAWMQFQVKWRVSVGNEFLLSCKKLKKKKKEKQHSTPLLQECKWGISVGKGRGAFQLRPFGLHVKRTPLGTVFQLSPYAQEEADCVGVYVKRWEEVLFLGMIISLHLWQPHSPTSKGLISY